MEWVDRLNEVIGYIEDHLDGEISNEVIRNIALCSVGPFQRTFSLMTGITLSEYIRRRRLTNAAFELQSTDCKVIDVAAKYGYESPDAFCVAFRKMHGIAPAAARQPNIKLKSYPRLSFTLTIKGDAAMNYRVVHRDGFRVTGRVVTSSLENNITGQFWDQCKADGTVAKLIEIGANSCTLGVCFGYDDEGFNDYMVGVEIDRDQVETDRDGVEISRDRVETRRDQIETDRDQVDDMKTVEIPESSWLVFESIGPVAPTLGNTWGRIYGEFLPQSVYRQASLPTIEKYFGGDVDADDYRVEIWIPIARE